MKTSPLLKKIFSKKTLSKYESDIMLLGTKSKYTVNSYLTIKLIVLFVVFTLTLFFARFGYITSFVITVFLYFAYDYVLLEQKIKKRANILEHDAIFFFEVFSLTLQSEKNIRICLKNTCDSINSDLSLEFKEALKECSLGKSLTEGLENLKKRIPSKTVNNVILNIIESNEYGISLIGTIENQIEFITDTRILRIKGKINKMPTKISVVSVLLFIPLIMLLILGPVLINYFLK